MSGLYLIVLIVIWLFVGRMIYRVWRRWEPVELTKKILHATIGVVLFSIWFGGAFWEVTGKKMYYDAQVRELCAKDGGVKVYETVTLPVEIYNQYARRNWILPNKDEAGPTDEYYCERDNIYYRENDPRIVRSQTKTVRLSDGKVLGVYIHYGRSGGDLPGPWHNSSFSCPDPIKVKFQGSIFMKGDN